jgi:hypothetical protein
LLGKFGTSGRTYMKSLEPQAELSLESQTKFVRRIGIAGYKLFYYDLMTSTSHISIFYIVF